MAFCYAHMMGLFGKHKVVRQAEYISRLLPRVVQEGERVYRNQVEELCSGEASISSMGMYKARLFTSAFLIWSFRTTWWSKSRSDVQDLLAVAMRLAANTNDPTGAASLFKWDRTNTKAGVAYLNSCLQAIDVEMQDGPSRSGRREIGEEGIHAYADHFGKSANERAELLELAREIPRESSLTKGFLYLKERWVEALEESIGTPGEKDTKEFLGRMSEGAVWSNLRLLEDVRGELR